MHGYQEFYKYGSYYFLVFLNYLRSPYVLQETVKSMKIFINRMDFTALGQQKKNGTFTIFGIGDCQIETLSYPVNSFAKPPGGFISNLIKRGVNDIIHGLSCTSTLL